VQKTSLHKKREPIHPKTKEAKMDAIRRTSAPQEENISGPSMHLSGKGQQVIIFHIPDGARYIRYEKEIKARVEKQKQSCPKKNGR